jgi:outer membrane protein with beta-barrel domain
MIRNILLIGTVLMLGLAAFAQEYPLAEVAATYSYVRYAPSAQFTQGHSLNGAGGAVTYNFNDYVGIKMDLQGFGSNETTFTIPAGTKNFPGGASGRVQGNLFTYMFGPQIKFRTPKFHPFGHLLFGGAHSNVYGNAFKTICQPIVGGCAFAKAPTGDAFAMAFGGGIDIPVNHVVSLRAGEVDYLLTRFTNPFTDTNQSNFRYSGGIVFSFGQRTHQ